MATQTPNGSDGTLNGTTAVELVPAPAASKQHVVHGLTIQNRDTAVVALTVRKVSAGGTRQIWKGDLDVGDTWELGDTRITLDDTGSSVTAVLGAAAATTNPDFTSSWILNEA